MRLGRLSADATIVFDGDVDVASKPVARLLPRRAEPPARLDLRDTALRREAQRPKQHFPPYSLTMPDQVSNI